MGILRRAGVAIGFAIVGALVGAVTTVVHRQLPPWGLLAGIAVIATLAAGARLAAGGRAAAAAVGLGALLAVAVLALPRGDGSVLVRGDALGLGWVAGVAVAVVAAVAWPAPRPAQEAPPGTE